MQRLFITALACLITNNLFCQIECDYDKEVVLEILRVETNTYNLMFEADIDRYKIYSPTMILNYISYTLSSDVNFMKKAVSINSNAIHYAANHIKIKL